MTPVLDLLELLKDDAELYVRRSVANNLNDISKDNSEVVVSTLTSWGQSSSEEMQRLIGHALRTLLKQGNVGAFGLLGYVARGVGRSPELAKPAGFERRGPDFPVRLCVCEISKADDRLPNLLYEVQRETSAKDVQLG